MLKKSHVHVQLTKKKGRPGVFQGLDLAYMETEFQRNPNPTVYDIEQYSSKFDMGVGRVTNWFRNRRNRKPKQRQNEVRKNFEKPLYSIRFYNCQEKFLFCLFVDIGFF
jgi:hypothetical protein